ncbi:uncharacterized protein HKW66_Vig0071580 [Vigna angularis]|uniref:Transmembrane protein n=1 Tax=Phaseolus angularis TaxID=3914 RepID=A0A8T0K763_PHAAN|nr:uncharacterized protein HKW66_Vig0071580 [Vigna angularis]
MSSSRRIGPPKNQRPQALRVPGLNKAFLPHQQKVAPGGPTDRRPARHGSATSRPAPPRSVGARRESLQQHCVFFYFVQICLLLWLVQLYTFRGGSSNHCITTK